MSVVTNVLILPEYTPPPAAEILRAGFKDGDRTQVFRDIADYGKDGNPANYWGGGKVPECEVWAGAFNHLNFTAMLDWLRDFWPSEFSVRIAVLFDCGNEWEWHTL